MSDGSDGSHDDSISVVSETLRTNKTIKRAKQKSYVMNTGVNSLTQPLLASLGMISIVIMICVVIN